MLAQPTDREEDMKTDIALKHDLTREFAWDARLVTVQIAVRAGIVTLHGAVASDTVRRAALDAARRVAGVVEVVSRIEVRPNLTSESSSADDDAVRDVLSTFPV